MDRLTLFSQSIMSIAEHLDRPSKVFTSPRRTPAVEALGIKRGPSLEKSEVGGGPLIGGWFVTMALLPIFLEIF